MKKRCDLRLVLGAILQIIVGLLLLICKICGENGIIRIVGALTLIIGVDNITYTCFNAPLIKPLIKIYERKK